MKSPVELRADAAKCRRLAAGLTDDRTKASLLELAESYELQAAELEAPPSEKSGSIEA